LIAVALLLCLHLQLARSTIDIAADKYAKSLEDSRQDRIAADVLLGKITPLYTGYAGINSAVPVGVQVNCHYGSTPFNNTGSNSTSAQEYIKSLDYFVGDDYQPVPEIQPKGTYNQSWSLGLAYFGRCAVALDAFQRRRQRDPRQ
jgi:hypothetical protein